MDETKERPFLSKSKEEEEALLTALGFGGIDADPQMRPAAKAILWL